VRNLIKQWHVGILLFDGVDIIDFSGPYEVFSYAPYNSADLRKKFITGTVTEEDRPMITHIVSETGDLVFANNGMKVQPDYSFQNAPSFDILIIPGAPLAALEKVLKNQSMIEWIRQRHDEVECLASVCSGAFLLAQAGLLKGKKATTHHAACDYFQKRFPDIHVQRGVRVVDEGRVVTSAGATSGINMALYIVERFIGKEIAQSLAHTIEFENNGRVLTR
jgi:transcriptional regulator GlxA family with amidase domain